MKENDLRGLKGKKVYISGKITGMDQAESIAKFGEAEKMLEELGAIPFNPYCFPEGLGYYDYMDLCFVAVRICNAIYMLDNWRDSKGAKAERKWATKRRLRIIYQGEKDQEATGK